jgi:hypothetical protein
MDGGGGQRRRGGVSNPNPREIKLICFYGISINVSLDTIVSYPIEMKSFIRGVLERVSFSVKSQTTVAAAAAAPPVLGRWGIQYDQRIIDRKITQANEDHCGCCVVDETKKNKTEAVKKSSSSVVRYEKKEEYLLPYVM